VLRQTCPLLLIDDQKDPLPYHAHPAFFRKDVVKCLVDAAIAQAEQRIKLPERGHLLNLLAHAVPFWKKAETHRTPPLFAFHHGCIGVKIVNAVPAAAFIF
jgi:hypothetical protein